MYSTYTRLISHILLLSEHQHYSLIIIGYVGFLGRKIIARNYTKSATFKDVLPLK